MSSKKIISDELQSMLRVDQAGEYGAVRIYEGQLAFIRDPKQRALIEHMQDQEREHLRQFNHLLIEHRVTPTWLTPLWHVGGYVMGAVSALISDKGAHACTVGVEDVIDRHYQDQIDTLTTQNDDISQKLKTFFEKCQAEEQEHKDIAKDEGGADPAYYTLTNVIKGATQAAIWLSKRI